MGLFSSVGKALGSLTGGDILSAGLSVGSALLGSNASKKAASAGADAANSATALQREQFNTIQNNLRPQQIIGTEALFSLADLYGLSRPAENQFIEGEAVTGSPFGSGGTSGGNLAGFLSQDAINQAQSIYNPYRDNFRSNVGGGESFGRRFIQGLSPIEDDPRFLDASPEVRDAVRLLATAEAQKYGGNLPGTRESESEGYLGGAFESDAARRVSNNILRKLSGGSQLSDFLATPGGGQTAISSRGAGGPDYSQFFKSPDYQFRLDEGVNALQRSAAARGLLNSGSTLRGITEYGQNLASGEYNNFTNRLFNLAGFGSTATSQANQAGQVFGQQAGNNAIQAGNARASGFINQANAINDGIGSIANIFGRNSVQQPKLFGQTGAFF